MATVCGSDFIDLDRYPIDCTESDSYANLLAGVRDELRSVGCAVIPSFVKPERIELLTEEAEQVAEYAHSSFNRTNAYFTTDDDSLPETHPVRRFYDRSNAFVPADKFTPEGPLRSIYEWPPVMAFIRDCLEENDFHRYADPLADVIINVVEDGDGFPWHFDTNNFTVTLAIRNAEQGGMFEFVPNVRTATDENYEHVQAVQDGDRSEVRTLELNPGDLQIFKGRYSLHRVTPVRGTCRRYVGIFSFVDQPGMVGKVERVLQLYGRTLPVHHVPQDRKDALLD